VVDANVLVSELSRIRGRGLIESPALSLRVSEEVLGETLHELRNRAAKIVERRRASREAADKMLEDAAGSLERGTAPVPREVYAALEERAAYCIPRDPDDAQTVALALALGGDEGRCGIWTNDGDSLGRRLPPTWTTDTLLAHLRYGERV